MNFLHKISPTPLQKPSVKIILTAALGLLFSTTILAQNPFPTGGFTLPPGKTIIVTYEVTVNANACPTGTSPGGNISNQSQVQGGNFTTVNTHETTPGTPDPTLTPFGALSLGNLVYKDVNKDGDYDNGTDTPIDGVQLRLYADDGDGVLDAGDGAHIATATTMGGGLYSFAVCPGDYIVEVISSNFNSGNALYDNTLMAALLSSPIGGAPDPDNDVDDDDNGDPVNGFGVASAAITVAYGAEPDGLDMNTNNRLDFGFKTPTTVTINDVTMTPEGTGGGSTTFNFTVTRSDDDEAFSLTVNTSAGTATSGTDFTPISGGTVSFTAGGSTMETVTVNVAHDNIVEDHETFSVLLSGAPSGIIISDGTGDGVINNDDMATLTLSGSASQNEGGTFTFTATLNNPVQGGFQVAYTTNDGITNPATAGSDYTDNDGNLTFLDNATGPQSWTVNTGNDNTVELDETIRAVLGSISMTSAVQAAAISTSGSPQTGTILNDDQAEASFTTTFSANEGNSGTQGYNFTLNLSNPVDVPIEFGFSHSDGTATAAGNDYLNVSGAFTVPIGAFGNILFGAVPVIKGDTKVEANEIFNVALSANNFFGRNVVFAGGGSSITNTVTITNDDNCTVTLTPAGGVSQNEGNSGATNFVFTATPSAPVQGGFSIAYTTSDGTATVADNDYADNDGTLNFADNSVTPQNITVVVNGDLNIETNETFTVALDLGSVNAPTPVQTNAVSTAGSPQTGTILNDEKDWGDAPTAAQSGFASSYPTTAAQTGASHDLAPGGLRLGATVDADLDGQPNATATGDGADEDGVTLGVLARGTTASITVNASGAGRLNAWVDWNRNGSWADAGEKIFNDVLVTAGNNTLNISVPVGASLGTSFARFRLTTATGTGITGAAADGEVEDYQVSIVTNAYSISSPSVIEGSAPNTVVLNFVISRLDFTNAGSVDYSIPTGTATAGTDYVTIPPGTISFMAGDNQPATVSITVNGDAIVEDNETVVITLSNPVNGGIAAGTGTGTINNDDNATLTLAITGGGASQNEGNTFTFAATLNNPVQGGFQVAYTTNNGVTDPATAGSDYTDNDGNLIFLGNANEPQSWMVNTSNDNTVELDETLRAVLGSISMTSVVQAAAITINGSPQTATLLNDDAATVSIQSNKSELESVTPQAFVITLSNPVDAPVSVNFNTADNTANAGSDYTGITNQPVTFPANNNANQSVDVTIANDNTVEADEVYNVSIGTLSAGGRNVTLGTSARTGTIQNNDATTVTLTPVGGVSQNEGNSGTTNFMFTAELTNPVQGGFSLSYTTSDGTASTADNDYVDNDGPALVFAGTLNEMEPITVQVNGDNKVEANETFTVQLGSVSNTTLGGSITVVTTPRTGTINNDEVDWGDAPDPIYPTLLANNGARHKTNFGVHLGAGIDGEDDGQPNANADGDGADEDGVTLPGALVINTSANITVNASTGGLLNAWVDFNGNGNWESPSEQIFTNTALVAGNNALSFSVPAGATLGTSYARFRFGNGNLSPTGQDNTGEVEDYKIDIVNTLFSIDNPSVTEGNSPGTTNLTFRISRNVNANACSVQYTVTNGTATTADNDYTAGGIGTAIFSAGGAFFQDITIIAVNGDNKVELDETVLMTLSNPMNASIASGMGTGTGTITNDDQGVITISNPTVTEGDAGTVNAMFNISLSNPSDANVDLNHLTQDGTAMLANNDFQITNGTLTFTPGQTMKTVNVPVVGDCAIETNEQFALHLTSLLASGRNIIFNGGGATLDGTGTITNDDALPVITCGGNVSQNAAPGTCAASITLALPSTSSLCGTSTLEFRYRSVNNANVPTGAFSGYFPAASNTQSFPVGRHEVEWRVTDGSGSSTCSLYVEAIDNQNPSITCPMNFSKNTDPNLCSAVVTYPPPTASDNCPGATVTRTGGLASGSVFPKGVNMVEWKATDASGNMSVCQFTVTIIDNQLPSISCPANIVRNADAGLCTAVVTYAIPTATDNCSGVMAVRTSAASTASGSAFPKGPTTVTWEARDAASPANTQSCSFTVTVNDTQLPSITCPANQTVGNTPGSCSATVNYATPAYSDNCPGGGAALQSGLPSGGIFPKGQTTVIWRATDAVGLTKTCSFRVTVNDVEAPSITCPTVAPTTTTPASCTSAAVNYPTPTAVDNCPGTLTIVRISGPASGSSFPLGVTSVVWRAIDAAGRSSTCTFPVVVTDATPPTITCPGNIAVTAPPGQCSTPVGYTLPSATDNCGVQAVFLLSGLTSGSTFPQGATVNTWRATDNAGLSSTCSFTVTVGCGSASEQGGVSREQWALGLKPETSNFKLQTLNLTLSPNPAMSEVQIWIEGLGENGGELLMSDLLGRVLVRQHLISHQHTVQLDLSDPGFASGLYQVILRSEEGKTVNKPLLINKL